MRTIILGMLIDTETMMIIWAIGLFVLFVIFIISAISKREKSEEENFIKNIKIGAGRTIGGLLVFLYLWILILSTIFFVKKIEENKIDNKPTTPYKITK